MNGIERGFVDSVNPFNRKYISRISLKPEDVTCFVFWTKNPKPFMKYLDELDQLGYHYYFQFSLNPYSDDIEKNVPKANQLIKTFIDLSNKIGKEKVIWRYDPILLNKKYTKEYHYKYFEILVKLLRDYTNQVVISFIDFYRKTKRNTKDLFIEEFTEATINELAKHFSQIASTNGLEINTCSETIDLKQYNVKHGKCINDDLIRFILGNEQVKLKKDKGQRNACGCVESIDIGTNDTCKHFCAYCYANTSKKITLNNYLNHNPNLTLLSGKLYGDEIIYWRNGTNKK